MILEGGNLFQLIRASICHYLLKTWLNTNLYYLEDYIILFYILVQDTEEHKHTDIAVKFLVNWGFTFLAFVCIKLKPTLIINLLPSLVPPPLIRTLLALKDPAEIN